MTDLSAVRVLRKVIHVSRGGILAGLAGQTGGGKLPPFLNCMDKMAEQGCSKETVVKDDELDDLLESGSLTMLS